LWESGKFLKIRKDLELFSRDNKLKSKLIVKISLFRDPDINPDYKLQKFKV
jgi:hypothetical protein